MTQIFGYVGCVGYGVSAICIILMRQDAFRCEVAGQIYFAPAVFCFVLTAIHWITWDAPDTVGGQLLEQKYGRILTLFGFANMVGLQSFEGYVALVFSTALSAVGFANIQWPGCFR